MKPYFRPEDVVVFGFREEGIAEDPGFRDVRSSGAMALSLSQIRALGFEQALKITMAQLLRPELDGLFVHFDADALDDSVMPAVDYRMPGGLAPSEVAEVLHRSVTSGRFRGMTVTIYNPQLDDTGDAGKVLTRLLTSGLNRPWFEI
jgi:arginase